MKLRVRKSNGGNISAIVIPEQDSRKICAVNRQLHEKRVEHSKNTRANVANRHTSSNSAF